MLTEIELTGRSRTHVTQIPDPRFAAQPEVAAAFLDMRSDAQRAGFDVMPYSSFRDFRTQLRIWNSKFSGVKPLFDINGRPRDFHSLTPSQKVDCILNWSALPGSSRHHWGTEIDVIDAAAMPANYEPQLLPNEVARGGIFSSLHMWLDAHITQYGFFRPYQRDNGGMYPEPWHLSYAPLSLPLLDLLTLEVVTKTIEQADIFGKALILEKLPEIHRSHILNISLPEAALNVEIGRGLEDTRQTVLQALQKRPLP